MRFSQSTHLLICLSLETSTSIIRTGLPILVELIDLVNSVIILLSQTTLLRQLTFLLRSQTVILTVQLFWIYLFLLALVFVFKMAFPPLGNSDHVVVSVSTDFPSNSQRGAMLHRIACGYSCADWDVLCDHLRDVPWEDIFCESVQVGIDVYIPHCKYQVKPHSSACFSAAYAVVIVHRNHFFDGSGEKSSSKDMEKNVFSFQICHNQFLYLKTQATGAWKLQCAQFLLNRF